ARQDVATAETAPVYIVPISGTIDLGLAPYLSRVLDQAANDGAAAVILDVDTPGGRLDAVLQMRDAMLGSDVRTIAFVDRTAFSAGALIAIAAEEIYMAPGAVIGAATPVDGATGETASEKIVSAVRTTFKATAEARDRNPLVAEAMVDPEVVIDGLDARGELLTLTTEEAIAWGYSEGIAADRAALLIATGLEGATVVETEPSLAERLVRFITEPVVSTLLISAGMLLIIADFFVEGFGLLGVAGLGALALFFGGHALAGLAGWEDVVLVLIGLALIAIEILVIPGFGVPGVLGVVALLGGLFLAMLGREIQTPEGIEQAALTAVASLIAVVIGTALVFVFFARHRRLGPLVLQATAQDSVVTAGHSTSRWLNWFGSPAQLPRGAHITLPGAPQAAAPDLYDSATESSSSSRQRRRSRQEEVR
ncbi:MAG: ATP-dependent Clp protease proteolytic subunit, partial [Chloroflexota bacterium]|nr:ATP-dependent Clp protease proteolytic subunit [Chloroflexota bacterium]